MSISEPIFTRYRCRPFNPSRNLLGSPAAVPDLHLRGLTGDRQVAACINVNTYPRASSHIPRLAASSPDCSCSITRSALSITCAVSVFDKIPRWTRAANKGPKTKTVPSAGPARWSFFSMIASQPFDIHAPNVSAGHRQRPRKSAGHKFVLDCHGGKPLLLAGGPPPSPLAGGRSVDFGR